MQKCIHSVYLASSAERLAGVALYCSFCNPAVDGASSSQAYLLSISPTGAARALKAKNAKWARQSAKGSQVWRRRVAALKGGAQ
jgi:hypothetical protein